MEPIIKWIGGASAALVLAVGGASLAGDYMARNRAEAPAAPTLDEAIPVDEGRIGGAETVPEGAPEDTDAQIQSAVETSATVATDATAQPAGVTSAATVRPASNQQTANTGHFTVKRILDIPGPIKYGDWYWDTEGVPEGPLVITVDLNARVISVFRSGYEIGAAAAMLGTPEHPTPTGTFPIMSKERHNISEKYGDAPMPWTLRLTRDGVAIHGGSQVENGYASHGCIAIPDELASRLFAVAKRGDRVIITRGKSMGVGDKII